MNIRSFCILTFFLLFAEGSHELFAQPVLTLQESVRAALLNNYDIRLAENDSALLALDNRYRNVVFLPAINAVAGTTWNANNQKQKFSDDTERAGNVSAQNINASIALEWVLFDGLKMFATRRKAEEFANLGSLTVQRQVVNTVANVITTYYNIVSQKQQLSAIEEQMKLSQTRVDLAQRKLEIGVGAKPEVLQSQVDYNAQQALKLRQITLIKQLKATLVQLINGNAGNGPDPDGFDVDSIIPIDMAMQVESLKQNLDSTNPDLAITQKNLDIAELTLKEIRAQGLPTVSFNAAYNFASTNNNIAINPFVPVFTRNRGLNYGFTANIPILNYRNNHRLIQQAKLNLAGTSLLMDSQRSVLELNIENAFKEYEFQKEVLALEESNIKLAQENVNIMQATYKLGETTFILLREAEQSLQEAYRRLIAARYNTKVAETELLRIKGDLIQVN